MDIRKLNNTHYQEVANLILPIQQEEFGVNVTIEDQPDLLDIDGFYNKKGGLFIGMFVDNHLVGTIAYLNIGHHSVALRKMFVKQDFRGKEFRIAQNLLLELEKEAKAANIQHLFLGTVDKMKAAHRFYEKNGFIRIEKDALPSYFPLMDVDNVFYQKDL